MAKLPGPEERAIPRPAGGVVRIPRDPRNAAMIGAGNAIMAGANDLYAAIEEEQRRIDTIKVEDRVNALKRAQLDLSMGENGFKQKKSGDAVNAPLLKDYTAKLQDNFDRLSETLDNPDQKQQFMLHYEVVSGQMQRDILAHQNEQYAVYQKEEFLTTAETERYNAGLHPYSKTDIDGATLRTRKAAERYGRANGMSPEAIEALYREEATKIHAAVIEAAINDGQTAHAKNWLRQHREEIDPTVAERLEKSMKESDERYRAQRAEDKIWSEGGTLNQMLDKARGQPSDIRDSVVARIKTREAERKYITEEEAKTASMEAWKIAAVPGSRPDDIPSSLIHRMDGNVWASMQTYINNRNAGIKTQTDWATWYMLKNMATSPDRDTRRQFGMDNLLAYRHLLSDTEFKQVAEWQDSILNEDSKGIDLIRSDDLIVKQGMLDAGIDPGELTKKGNAGDRAREFYSRVEAEAQKPDGTHATGKELEDIVTRIGIKVARDIPYWPFDSKKAAGIVEIEGVPTDMIDELAWAIQQTGETPTVDKIKELYRYLYGR